MADNNIDINDFDGGSSNTGNDTFFVGGSAGFALDPLAGSTGGFNTEYINIAQQVDDLARIEATFKRFNDPTELRFIKESFDVVKQDKTLDILNVVDFFHPLQSFSDYQKQTMVIAPRASANLDPSSFVNTNGEVSMIIARAYYLPETPDESKILFWDYKGTERNIMGELMILTGAIKEGYNWRGWDVDPFSTYGHTGNANSALGGFIFTNPTDYNVKLTVITAN